MQTEKAFVLKAAGHWASSGLTKQPVSRTCPQPGGMALSYPRLLAGGPKRVPWFLTLPSFLALAPNTDQTLGRW